MVMKYIRINIYLSAKQREGAIKVAKEKDIKFSEAVRQAISEYVERHEKGGKDA